MKILLIAGHGASDPGAVATLGGKTRRESDMTRALTETLMTRLRRAGAEVACYPTGRNAYSDYKDGSLKHRADFSAYDFVLEIHFNAFLCDTGDGKLKGVECYVTTGEQDIAVAEGLCREISALGFSNRGVKRKNFAVIGAAAMAGTRAALLEVCFLDDADDMALYEEKRDDVAEAICRSFGLTKTPREIVREKAGLEEKTMDYLAAYQWGEELLQKLAAAME